MDLRAEAVLTRVSDHPSSVQGLQAQKFLFNVTVLNADGIPPDFTSVTIEWKARR